MPRDFFQDVFHFGQLGRPLSFSKVDNQDLIR